MEIQTENLFKELRDKMEAVGFEFEREQKPHFQDKREKELKFVHPVLNYLLSINGRQNRATKYYLKPISDVIGSEIGLTTGRSTLLTTNSAIHEPNENDTHGNTPAWVNRPNDNCLDKLLTSIDKYIKSSNTTKLENHLSDFEKDILNSQKDTTSERLDRLRDAPKIPSKLIVMTTAYKRNADVVSEVLKRANGICELCKQDAPFLRKSDNSPYLEVHHVVQLANGGEDTIENAVGICPNCHREQHFGL